MRWSRYLPSQQSPAYRRTLRIGLILIAVRLGGLVALGIFEQNIQPDGPFERYMGLFIFIVMPEWLLLDMWIRDAGWIGVIILTSFFAAWLRVMFVPPPNAPGEQSISAKAG